MFYRLGRLGEPRNACGADVGTGGCGRLRNSRGLGMTGGSHSRGPPVSGSRWERVARGCWAATRFGWAAVLGQGPSGGAGW